MASRRPAWSVLRLPCTDDQCGNAVGSIRRRRSALAGGASAGEGGARHEGGTNDMIAAKGVSVRMSDHDGIEMMMRAMWKSARQESIPILQGHDTIGSAPSRVSQHNPISQAETKLCVENQSCSILTH